MDFLINNAYAQSAAQPQADPFMTFLPLIIIFVIFYFLLIRPQTKRAKEHRKMVDALSVGDEVITNGGLAGRVSKLDDQFIKLELSKGVEVRLQRHAVSSLLPKGTLKSLD